MNRSPSWHAALSTPALLRHARMTYGTAMRQSLAQADYEDIPRNGLYLIGGLALGAGDVPLARLVRDLGISKQSAGQLVDTLVTRGYLERHVDPDDRRRLNVTLTERGLDAARVQTEARERIDAALCERIGAERVQHLRQALAALIEIGSESDERA